jgi:malate dehydrogenase (oxaloacetate-decarboxylating)
VVTLAALLNALRVVKKNIENIEVVVNGSGAAGIAVTKLLMSMGLQKVILCDTKGAIYEGRDGLNAEKSTMAKLSNLQKKKRLAVRGYRRGGCLYRGVGPEDGNAGDGADDG